MLVVPDTNAVYQDPFFKKQHIATIIATEEVADIRLMIPEVVVDELRGQVEKQLNDLENEERKLCRKFASISGQKHLCNVHITLEKKQAVLDQFDQRIKQFREQGRILTYPATSPRKLAKRSIRKQLPFLSSGSGNQKSDRGMRDTLIWLTLKEQLKETDDTILFATKDTAFVVQEGNRLHESLVSELKDEGMSQDAVTIARNLTEVVEFISTPRA